MGAWCAAARRSAAPRPGRPDGGDHVGDSDPDALRRRDDRPGHRPDPAASRPTRCSTKPTSRSALDYVRTRRAAPTARSRGRSTFAYVWGDALAELRARPPDLRIVNLETASRAATTALAQGHQLPDAPGQLPAASRAAGDRLLRAGQQPRARLGRGRAASRRSTRCDGGRDRDRRRRRGLTPRRRGARRAATGRARAASWSSRSAAATQRHARRVGGERDDRPGVNLLADTLAACGRRAGRPASRATAAGRHRGRLDPLGRQLGLRHPPAISAPSPTRLIEAGVDVVHGHSSHHPQGDRGLPRQADPLRLRRLPQRLRGDRRARAGTAATSSLLYVARLARSSGTLVGLEMVPFRIRQLPPQPRGTTRDRRAAANPRSRMPALRWRRGARATAAGSPGPPSELRG